MKKLLAVFGMFFCGVMAAAEPAMEYSVKFDKDVVVITETKGTVIVLPRTPVAKEVHDGEVIFFTMALLNDAPLIFAVKEKMCDAGSGAIGVITPDGASVVGLVEFDFKVKTKSPTFVAELLCESGKGHIKPTTDKKVKPTKNNNDI